MRPSFTKYIGFGILLIFVSCNFNYTFNENVTISEGKWFKNEAAHFEVFINDSLTPQDFYITLRNDSDYRFSNLFVFLTTRLPNGNMTRDTIEIVLADKSGKWLGNGWGNIKENKVLLNSKMRFPLTGKYEFFIQQAMRVDTLKGIKSVGIVIEKDE